MFIMLGIIIYVIGCCVSSYEDASYYAERQAERRHKEIMKAFEEAEKKYPTNKRTKKVRRRFAKDCNGNILGEEIITDDDFDF